MTQADERLPTRDAQGRAVFHVGAGNRPAGTGTALAHALYDEPVVIIEAIGPTAVSTAMKACAAAKDFIAERGYSLTLVPEFFTMPNRLVPGTTLTAMRFTVTRLG